MSTYTRQLEYEVRRDFDSATLTGSFQNFGAVLAHPASLIKMVNRSTVDIDISIDGVNSHDICPSNSFWLYDVTSDSPSESGSIFRKKGTQYSIKATAGAAGVGGIYLVVQYVVQL